MTRLAAPFLFVGLMAGAPTAAAETPSAPITVVEGDTVQQGEDRWRLVGLDAPEIHHARCPAEREAGVLAAARLVALIRAGGATLDPVAGKRKRDKYGRRLGRLMIGGEDWAAIAIREGHAVAWDGKGKRHDFCAGE